MPLRNLSPSFVRAVPHQPPRSRREPDASLITVLLVGDDVLRAGDIADDIPQFVRDVVGVVGAQITRQRLDRYRHFLETWSCRRR